MSGVPARMWLRWSLRDLRRRWQVVAATALVLAIGTGLSAGLSSALPWRLKSADASFATLAQMVGARGFLPKCVLSAAALIKSLDSAY